MWPPYRTIRFVLVRRHGTLRPARGFVLEWVRDPGNHHRALVMLVDEQDFRPAPRIEWCTTAQLIPVDIDPNWTAKW